jgi:hypothetical protein
MSFDPLNQTVPPGVWSVKGRRATYVEHEMEEQLASHLYDDNASSLIELEGLPPFIPQATAGALNHPQSTGNLGRLSVQPYISPEYLAEIEQNDAKFNPFNFDQHLVDISQRPAGSFSLSWVVERIRSDRELIPPWESPIFVPPCTDAEGSVRPDVGLLYPRKV